MKRRTIMTCGCFDILHPGHITLLQQSYLLGNKLIVALNSDKSIERIKGRSPINDLVARTTMLLNTLWVDEVIPFWEEEATDVIQLVQPDIFTKGCDYDLTQIPEKEIVEEYGGSVVIIGERKEDSSTRIRKCMNTHKKNLTENYVMQLKMDNWMK